MDIIVSARHFTLSEALKLASENAVHAALDDLNLKISTVRVTLDVQKNVHSVLMAAAIKDCPCEASVENLNDMNKAIVEAADRLRVQAKRYLEKRQEHRDRGTLKEMPEKEAEE